MKSIDSKEIIFLSDQILKKYERWYENKYSRPPKRNDFNSYLGGYNTICQSFDEIVGEDVVKNHTLRKLFYYSKYSDFTSFTSKILDAFYKYFSGKTETEFYENGETNKLYLQVKELFENEFLFWRDVDSDCFIEHGLLTKVLKLLDISSLDDQRKAFVIMNCTHFGYKSTISLIETNRNNRLILAPLYRIAIYGGNRESWRALYFLSQMNHTILSPFLNKMERETIDATILNKINLIKSSGIIDFLFRIESEESKLSEFASQVLKQLQSR